MGENEISFEDLVNRDGWVVFTYDDNSKVRIRTTLNEDMLKSVGGSKPNALFDLDKHKWFEIPEGADMTANVYGEKPKLGEVDEFVSRFV